ncbi:MAG: ABC transporter permease [Patescibacteria group bacterium]|jgi:putative ABC transport system permease protein
MYISDAIKIAEKALLTNKKRAVLTILGIVIGITAVIVIMAVGAGAQSLIVNQINSLGSNLVGILPGGGDEKSPPAFAFGIVITTLKNEDIDAIRRELPEVVAASGIVTTDEVVSYEEEANSYTIIGGSAEFPTVNDLEIDEGRWFSGEEERGLGRVAIIGSQIKEEIFPDEDPIGHKIKIKKESFTIIGYTKPKGSAMGQSFDKTVYLPVSSGQKLIMGIDYLNYARIKIDTAENIEPTILEMERILRQRHNIDNPEDDDFSVRNQAAALDTLTSITDYLRFFLAAIAAIALLVGGIGIMNIMLVSVTERTREIGLRKAVGAAEEQILLQFLLEAVFLTFIAGIIGIILGGLISLFISFVMNYLGYSWSFVISFSSIIIGVGVAGVIGLVFGYYPALRAAKLDPIDSLR